MMEGCCVPATCLEEQEWKATGPQNRPATAIKFEWSPILLARAVQMPFLQWILIMQKSAIGGKFFTQQPLFGRP